MACYESKDRLKFDLIKSDKIYFRLKKISGSFMGYRQIYTFGFPQVMVYFELMCLTNEHTRKGLVEIFLSAFQKRL